MTQLALAELTTLRVGGAARTVVTATDRDALIDATLDAWDSGEHWFILGGGSNVVVADDGFDGTVIRVLTRGIEELPESDATTVRLRVAAGEPWDGLVAHTVERGWSGIEALSGIPGSTGAAPIQNIGAYGAELASSLVAVEFLNYLTGELRWMPAAELALGYRTSIFKQGTLGLVVSIDLQLDRGDGQNTGEALSAPIAYDQLAKALGVNLGERVELATVRSSVLALRASKGMVLDPADPDSVSAGSFFTNPLVGENFARTLPPEAPRWLNVAEGEDVAVPLGEMPARPPERTDFRVKLSAAWLIEKAGIQRGFALPGSRAAISSKHTLAIVNTGGASAADIAELARFVQTRVFSEFGVKLHPEPVFIGHEL
ncbi:MAG: UDP-N-acetylmuramate dehydrogenase [Rhodoglobus sp.]